ncbi:hypothetical protein HAZT_HAZT011802 [Hyalella azteca]|uniref:eEF-1B gamma n=1 Tax=Hyalella azteca TaxID=294128 RepID=A0A6A0HCQ3_HYAAZ|nr:hypothetical protein HAZT_HAZT011802 [Hyalella azteca]
MRAFPNTFISLPYSIAEVELLPASCTWVFPCLGLMPFNKGSNDRAKEDVKKFLSLLNSHLLTRTYLVGERISLADISVACTLLQLYQHVLEPSFRAPYQNLNRWFTTMINQPQVKAVIGNFELCSKMLTFDNKKFAEVQGKLKSGDAAPKKEKKQEKPEKKDKPAKEAKEPEEEPAPAPKPKDPLAALPAGSFNLDDFKRFYSNNEEEKSVPYFWEKFDKEHYSIWFGEYKFPEELSKIFMSCNLVSGMFQRLDKLRNNAFASVCVFGTDGDNTISGVWVWRGQELAFPGQTLMTNLKSCNDKPLLSNDQSWAALLGNVAAIPLPLHALNVAGATATAAPTRL